MFNKKNDFPVSKKFYKDNQPTGDWIYFDEKGEIEFDLIYRKNSKQEDVIEYDIQSGKIIGENSDNFVAPKYLGENENFQWFIAVNINYPDFAKENGIQGTVYVQTIINENGKFENISILKGVHEVLDKESFRIIKTAGEFEPAILNGQKIKVYTIIPIRFVLR
ncbi:MAG: energy transducer TonB [Chlorobi bacterium]|nr:energy transducer TonB [Chlorobiota bacterium]